MSARGPAPVDVVEAGRAHLREDAGVEVEGEVVAPEDRGDVAEPRQNSARAGGNISSAAPRLKYLVRSQPAEVFLPNIVRGSAAWGM